MKHVFSINNIVVCDIIFFFLFASNHQTQSTKATSCTRLLKLCSLALGTMATDGSAGDSSYCFDGRLALSLFLFSSVHSFASNKVVDCAKVHTGTINNDENGKEREREREREGRIACDKVLKVLLLWTFAVHLH